MAIVVIFLLGIGNFEMHKAVLESGHRLLGRTPCIQTCDEGCASDAAVRAAWRRYGYDVFLRPWAERLAFLRGALGL